MDLKLFKTLVDARVALPIPETRRCDDTLFDEIRSCFTPRESDKARFDLSNVFTDLGLRYLCGQGSADPYSRVAEAIRHALTKPGNSTEETSHWERAIELAMLYAAGSSHLPPEQAWRSSTRVNCLSAAINGLRKLGYEIGLPASGGVDVPDLELKRIATDIECQAAALGSSLAPSAAASMKGTYSAITGRFQVGRKGQTFQLDEKPDLPYAYLYQLGLRYFAQQPSAPFPEAALTQLSNLVTWAITLLDLSLGTFELMFAKAVDLIRIMQKSVVYDSVFLLTQAKPSHASEYLEWMLSREPLSDLQDDHGRTAAQVRSIARMLLRACARACERGMPQDFIPVSVWEVAYATNLDPGRAMGLMRDVFAHPAGANQTLTFPPDDRAVDAAFRPLLMHDGRLVMQPAPMAARATVNAALQWCRENHPNKKGFDDKVIGPLFEEFVREKLAQHSVSTLHGKYKAGKSAGECDAVVETEAVVLFFELKSKMLRREARAGDDVAAIADLAQAVVRPQAQAMERHAVLREHGALTVTQGTSTATITLGAREVLKLSITRGDLGSLHDRSFLRLFLQTGCAVQFSAVDPTRQPKLDSLHEWFRKLKTAAARAGEPVFNTPFPFSTSWSLSVFHFLLLLERTGNSESFMCELQRTRYIATPVRDFYAEYEYALSLDKLRKQQEQNKG